MTNERMWAMCSGHSGQMSKWASRSVFWANQNHSFSLSLTKNRIFWHFLQFKKKQKICSFLLSESLMSLRRNERSWANPSSRSPKMSKWANSSLFERIAHSLTFLVKKRAIRSEIRWANSQPWEKVAKSLPHWEITPLTLKCTVWPFYTPRNGVVVKHADVQFSLVVVDSHHFLWRSSESDIICPDPIW